jgi:hypothetical protein
MLLCRLAHLSAEPERSEYQLQRPKRLSTLMKDRKLSVLSATNPKSRLIASTTKPLSKGFIDDNIYTDDDMMRLRTSILRKTDIYEFDRVIGSGVSLHDSTKRLFDATLKKPTE